ncbi:peptidoglycan editing factor PgeF [bacterium]|nr:peptidoglycan editing factor PgeF [bacterium]
MYYFEKITDKKILKSDKLDNALFTTKESFIKSKETNCQSIAEENFQMLKKTLKVEKLVCPNQTHSTNIDIAAFDKDEYPETDALILTDNRIGIYLNFADCTPIVIYDKVKNIGAIAHGGWRGTAGKIAYKTVLKMVDEFHCNPKDMIALIGPCISECCFEVGGEVYNKLMASVGIESNIKPNEKFHANLKEINKLQLEQAGINDIDICQFCTVCNNDNFFSYRKEKGTTNRHSAILTLR